MFGKGPSAFALRAFASDLISKQVEKYCFLTLVGFPVVPLSAQALEDGV